MTSKERMLTSIENLKADHIPCSFMLFSALCDQYMNELDYIDKQIAMGIDPKVELHKLPLRFHKDVTIKEYMETEPDGTKLIVKEYHTPKGLLTQRVKHSFDWSYGRHIPLLNDHIITRSDKFIATSENDLEALEYLFLPPSDVDIAMFRAGADELKKFADQRGLLVSGGWRYDRAPDSNEGEHANYGNMGFDALSWLCGMEKLLMLTYDNPTFVERLVDIVAGWNRKRLEIELDAGPDLILRRGWYESADIISPDIYRKYVVPHLREDIKMAHQAGVKFGYIITSGIAPLIGELLALDIDVILGIDPLTAGCGLKKIKETLGSRMCLWGGVSGSLTVERGGEENVRKAVEDCMSMLGENGGFILSPVDNITEDTPESRENIRTFLETWKALR